MMRSKRYEVQDIACASHGLGRMANETIYERTVAFKHRAMCAVFDGVAHFLVERIPQCPNHDVCPFYRVLFPRLLSHLYIYNASPFLSKTTDTPPITGRIIRA